MSCVRDEDILNNIFDPIAFLGNKTLNDNLPDTLKDEFDENIPMVEDVKKLEVEAVKLAEDGSIDGAIHLFSEIIKMIPLRPSSYNNRAQALRMKGCIQEALVDLNLAIYLSHGQGRSGCQAYCQRGIIHRKEGRNDLAKQDFHAAAELGSKFAKGQLIELNPYAALCNQMLHNVTSALNVKN